MSPVLDLPHLLADLKSTLAGVGIDAAVSTDGLAGTRENIRAKWFLGGRKVAYTMSCRLDAPAHCVRFREMVIERAWGIPPPTFSVETTTVSGWKRSGTRTDHAIGGGGTLDYAQVRDAVAATTAAAGWQFQFDGGRAP